MEPTVERLKVNKGMDGTAVLSADGLYRYRLTRQWEEPLGIGEVCWVMLNPSTADEVTNDPTIARCIGFSKLWGYGTMSVVNLFGYRSSDPKLMANAKDPVGPRNEDIVIRAVRVADRVVVAWGAMPKRLEPLSAGLRERLRTCGKPLCCLGITKGGHPRHPLYMPGKTELCEWA